MQNGSTLSTRALLKQLFKKAHLSSDGGHFGRPCSICKDIVTGLLCIKMWIIAVYTCKISLHNKSNVNWKFCMYKSLPVPR